MPQSFNRVFKPVFTVCYLIITTIDVLQMVQSYNSISQTPAIQQSQEGIPFYRQLQNVLWRYLCKPFDEYFTLCIYAGIYKVYLWTYINIYVLSVMYCLFHYIYSTITEIDTSICLYWYADQLCQNELFLSTPRFTDPCKF